MSRVTGKERAVEKDPAGWRLPTAYKTIIGSYKQNNRSHKWEQNDGSNHYGAAFYPYTKTDIDPVFACVGGSEVWVARPNDENGIEVIQHFKDVGERNSDEARHEELYAMSWTRDKRTSDPLLAVGGRGMVVKILNVRTGKVQQVMSGHGDEVMDITTHPYDQDIIASVSADSTARLWAIDPALQSQPCVLICAGNGHKETILTLAFHASGRYLLTGGMDRLINLWVLPEVTTRTGGALSNSERDKVKTLANPHFATAMVHSHWVDCVKFHGDYIISRAAVENTIVLWAITGFNSRNPPPTEEEAPAINGWQDTRSAFGGTFERLLCFSAPRTEIFFMRFGLFQQPHQHPILYMGSITGELYMWDLYMIEKYGKCGKSESGEGPGAQREPPQTSVKKTDDISDAFTPIKAHMTLTTKRMDKTIRAVAPSMDGRYVVVLGDNSTMSIIKRW